MTKRFDTIAVVTIRLGIVFLLTGGFALLRADEPIGVSTLAAARSLSGDERDSALRKLAVSQATSGDALSSLKSLSYVANPATLREGLNDIRLIASGGSDQGHDKIRGQEQGAAGGASLADFTSLIDLIQTTVNPDTWEALGGPSTMREYVAGILVDGDGVVQDIVASDEGAALDNLEVLLHGDNDKKSGVEDWRLMTANRCVSLSRLSQEVLRCRVKGIPVDDSLRNMAGLSRVQYIVIDRANRDVILVGPVGGIERRDGWFCDQKSGRATMSMEYFVSTATSILSRQPLGCTIDPTPQSLAAAASVASQFRNREIPIGMAADAIRKALGNQDVRVFGVAGDTPIAYLMVEADRQMKQLALGLRPMPEGVANYLDMITRHIHQGVPDGQLLRLWFTGSPMAVRTDLDGKVYELAGRPLKLDSETRMAANDGGRIAAPADFRVTEFVDEFNKHYTEIVSMHPIYGALESVYASAAVAEVIRRSDASPWMPSILGPMLLDDPSMGVLRTPRKVASVATLHRVTHKSERHAIIVASGGVMIETAKTVEATFRPYDTLSSLIEPFVAPERVNDAGAVPWWWNAK